MSSEWHSFLDVQGGLVFLMSRVIDHMAAPGRNTDFKNITIIF